MEPKRNRFSGAFSIVKLPYLNSLFQSSLRHGKASNIERAGMSLSSRMHAWQTCTSFHDQALACRRNMLCAFSAGRDEISPPILADSAIRHVLLTIHSPGPSNQYLGIVWLSRQLLSTCTCRRLKRSLQRRGCHSASEDADRSRDPVY
jgi:hypothetical protein